MEPLSINSLHHLWALFPPLLSTARPGTKLVVLPTFPSSLSLLRRNIRRVPTVDVCMFSRIGKAKAKSQVACTSTTSSTSTVVAEARQCHIAPNQRLAELQVLYRYRYNYNYTYKSKVHVARSIKFNSKPQSRNEIKKVGKVKELNSHLKKLGRPTPHVRKPAHFGKKEKPQYTIVQVELNATPRSLPCLPYSMMPCHAPAMLYHAFARLPCYAMLPCAVSLPAPPCYAGYLIKM